MPDAPLALTNERLETPRAPGLAHSLAPFAGIAFLGFMGVVRDRNVLVSNLRNRPRYRAVEPRVEPA